MNHLTIQGDKNLEGKKWKLCAEQTEKEFLILQQIQDDEIKVGDRVILGDIITRIASEELTNFYIIDEYGNKICYPKSYFTKLQKPKEGDEYWILYGDGSIENKRWDDRNFCNQVWDFGFGFHTESQASFCRDRVRRVI